jgi:H+/Cl- antiporter ClcA
MKLDFDLRERVGRVAEHLLASFKWVLFGILVGLVVGFCASVFAKTILLATSFRLAHTWIIFLMPAAGIIIVYLYHLAGSAGVGGTNLILASIRKGEEVPAALAPLIFVATSLTHLTGGSAGREGAALQMGGSMSSAIARLLHFPEEDRRQVIMCGMSAAFSALFGTPLAAAVLPMEISTVGIMYHSAFVPCVISSLTAHFVAGWLGLGSEQMLLTNVPSFDVIDMGQVAVFAILCALVAILFCATMHRTEHILGQKVPNDYVKVVGAGAIIIVLTLLVGDQTYNGAGSNIIEACVVEPGFRVPWYAFLLKIIFTVITLSGEYKGGEIVPSLFIGATFGNFFASLTGFDPGLCAAVGMASVFCGVTNCPIASLLISFELFGFEAMPFFLLAVAMAYLFSGNYGLYHGQMIRYSKVGVRRIDQHTR